MTRTSSDYSFTEQAKTIAWIEKEISEKTKLTEKMKNILTL